MKRALFATAAAAVLLLPAPVLAQGGMCSAHGAPTGFGTGVPLSIDFGGPENTISHVYLRLFDGYLRSWVEGQSALDITITSVNGSFHFHGSDVIPIDEIGLFGTDGTVATVIATWTEDEQSMFVNDVYTVCSQLFLGGTPVAPENCVDFGPFEQQ